MPQKYLSTDPNAGARSTDAIVGPQQPPESKYLSTDPKAGVDHPLAQFGRMITDNPGTSGAMLAGLVTAPFTGGLGLLGAMGAEAAAAGGGTMLGNAVAGKPQDMGETATNAAMGAAGPLAGRVLGGTIRLAQKTPGVVMDVAEHLPYVGGPIRLARGAMRVGRAMAPEAAPTAGPAARSFDDIAAETVPGYKPPSARVAKPPAPEPPPTRPPADPRDPPVREHGAPAEPKPAYAGPERRMTPREGVEAGLRDPAMVRKAAEMQKAHATIRKPAQPPSAAPDPRDAAIKAFQSRHGRPPNAFETYMWLQLLAKDVK